MKMGISDIAVAMILVGFTTLLVVVSIVILYGRIDLLFTNPCWKEAMSELDDIEKSLVRGKPATLVLDGECLKKIVFTPSRKACEDACKEYEGDKDIVNTCIRKCNIATAKTFIVALPKQRTGVLGYGKRVIDFISKRGLSWLVDGKPMVFTLDCEVTEFGLVKHDECTEEGSRWVCTPGEEKAEFVMRVVQEEGEVNTCTIVEA